MRVRQLTARLVVFESTGAWAVRLRRALGGARVSGGARESGKASDPSGRPTRVHEVRSWPEIPPLLSEAPASLLVIEVTDRNLEAVGSRLRWLGRDYPHVRAAVVGTRQLADTEWFLREQGAAVGLFSTREIVRLADLWKRQVARYRMDGSSVRHRLWDRLPWSDGDET